MSGLHSLPIILLITGAWHVPEHYSMLSNRLRHLGYTVECPLLTTNTNTDPPNKNLDDDVAQIRDLAIQYLDQGRDIVTLMHSYGGIVGTSALFGLGATDRNGLASVISLVYMAAFVPFEHEALAEIFGGALPPWLSPNSEGTIDITDPEHRFYHDLAPNERKKWKTRLVKHPTAAQFQGPKQVSTSAAWRSIPVTYLICNNDLALPVGAQEMMISRIEQADAGIKVHREYCEAGHSPFLSMPDRVVEVVRRACENVTIGRHMYKAIGGQPNVFINDQK